MSFVFSRRRALSLLAGFAVPTTAVATQANVVGDVLASASAAERAKHHANALAEVMAEIHPNRSWRSDISHDYHFALIVGDERKERRTGSGADETR
jgi:hypothetical protein